MSHLRTSQNTLAKHFHLVDSEDKLPSLAKRRSSQSKGYCVLRSFLSPAKLCQVYSQTLLNVHPALYEAYGMTILEAAAFCVPTLMNDSQIGT